jgi:hypothetical protein
LDTSRVSLGEMIAAAGGLVLLVCMFLPWFSGELSGRGRAAVIVPTTTGWESYSGVLDITFVVLAGLPIAIAIARANDSSLPLPIEQGALLMAAGALLFVIVVLRLIDPPQPLDVAIPGLEFDTTRKLAAFAAALAAAAIAVGGYLQRSMRRVGFEPTLTGT